MAAAKRCETGGGAAAKHMAAVEAVATAVVASLPPGYSVAFALVHNETGAMVASALPALEVPQIASIFERCTATMRGGVVQQAETHLYDRRDGSRVKKGTEH